MKAEVKYNASSDSCDLVISAENETETAILGMLRDRRPVWGDRRASGTKGQTEIVFKANEIARSSQD